MSASKSSSRGVAAPGSLCTSPCLTACELRALEAKGKQAAGEVLRVPAPEDPDGNGWRRLALLDVDGGVSQPAVRARRLARDSDVVEASG